MDLLKKICALFLFFKLSESQSGSSFYYYYSPKHPMIVNSQTYGSNPQSHQQRISTTDPYQFFNTFPSTGIPFLPQRSSSSPSQASSPSSSLLDKITFSNGPSPTPTVAYPNSPNQFYYVYHHQNQNGNGNPTPPTFTAKPSPKFANFLNQPFDLFRDNLNRFHVHPTPTQPAQRPSDNVVQRQQQAYSFQDSTRGVMRTETEAPKTTPLTFSVNQYFSSRTTKGPASYTFTIESSPGMTNPATKVEVKMGPVITFPPPTLSSLLLKNYEYELDSKPGQSSRTSHKEITSTTTPTPKISTSTTQSTVVPTTVPSSSLPPPTTTTSTESPVFTTTPTTTTSTANNIIRLDEDVGDIAPRRKPVKRVIVVRKKLLRRPVTNENYIAGNENKKEKQSTSNAHEVPSSGEIHTVTDIPLPSSTQPLIPITERLAISTARVPQIPSTSTTTPRTTTTTSSTEEPFSSATTTTTPEPLRSTGLPVTDTVDDDYEYYYLDEGGNDETSTSSTTGPTISTTISSTTGRYHEESSTMEIGYDNEPPTIPTFNEEDEIIEPLSTTTRVNEEFLSTTTLSPEEEDNARTASSGTESTTLTPLLKTPTTTEPFNYSTPKVTTFKPSLAFLTTLKPTTIKTNEVDEITTEEIEGTTTSLSIIDNNSNHDHEHKLFNETQNENNVNSTGNLKNGTAEQEPLNYDFHYDNQEYPLYGDEEEYKDPYEDEKIQEAQRLALQNALKNIRSRQQNASTTPNPQEEEKPSSSEGPKFVRKLTKSISFSTSSSQSSQANSPLDDNEGDHLREDAVQKIQRFKTKLRKVVSRVKVVTTKRPRRVTRPNPLVRSSTEKYQEEYLDTSTLSSTSTTTTISPLPTTEESTVISTTENKVLLPTTEVQPLPLVTSSTSTSPIPELISSTETTAPLVSSSTIASEAPAMEAVIFPTEKLDSRTTLSPLTAESNKSTSTIISVLTPTPRTISTSSTIPTSSSTLATTQKPSELTPPPTAGSLIITEILPSTTTTTTTRTDKNASEEPNQTTTTPLDFQLDGNVSNEEGVVTTIATSTTSTTVRGRKVKVILKRRKGAPKGSGSIARQVRVTRTRIRKEE